MIRCHLSQDAKDPETLANLVVCYLHLGKSPSRFLRYWLMYPATRTQFLFHLFHKFCYFMRGLGLWSCISYKLGATIEYNAEWLDFHCFSANWNLGTQITCSSNGLQLQKRDLTELSNQLLEISEVVFTQELFNAIVYSLHLSWRCFFWFLSW